MADKLVACHQPNFLPWLGFWAKLACADVFILLDDVQFTQGNNKHNWTTRVRARGPNGVVWLSVPVARSGAGLQRIMDLQSNPHDTRWLRKMIRTIEDAYRKSPYFSEAVPGVLEILSSHEGAICATNVALIRRITTLLRLPARIVLASELGVDGTSNERLINLTRAVGGDTYLAGDGAGDYQVEALFAGANIHLRSLGFKHPEYEQRGKDEFVAGLSVLDALCNVGPEATRELLHARD